MVTLYIRLCDGIAGAEVRMLAAVLLPPCPVFTIPRSVRNLHHGMSQVMRQIYAPTRIQ